jgi:uncharacterized protein
MSDRSVKLSSTGREFLTDDHRMGGVGSPGEGDRSPAGWGEYGRGVEDRPELARALDLSPHPEGGWFRETWRSPVSFRPPAYDGERASATAIYFLLGPGEESAWHRVRSAEIWLWHAGGPLVLRLGGAGADPGLEDEFVLGLDVESGQRPQVVVPANAWQSARPAENREVLVSCVVSPGFDFADFELL